MGCGRFTNRDTLPSGALRRANTALPMQVEFAYLIEEWSSDGEHLVEVLAGANHVTLATLCYWYAARKVRPRSLVRMCKQAQIIRERWPT